MCYICVLNNIFQPKTFLFIMKKTLLAAGAAFGLILSAFYFTACNSDKTCVECGVHGTCNTTTGDCDCEAGYKKDTNGRCDLSIDPCKDVTCGANATCDKGVCNCNAGYEKDAAGKCTGSNEKFKGSYTVFDTCSLSKTASYNVVVNAGSIVTEVLVTNFWNQFKNATKATVSGAAITIARQDPDKDKFFITGNGTITDKIIKWNYTITDETTGTIKSDACRAKWVK
jgi:hypothetical protein